MFASSLRYAVYFPDRLSRALADPVGTWDKVLDRFLQDREYRRPACRYPVTLNWEKTLHEALGLSWPCHEADEFRRLWPDVVDSVRARGVDVGPESFQGFNDGDAALMRAIWCLIRHARPKQVVETGVAHGFTSRFILEALARNGSGALSSIDRPPLDPATRNRIGMAVSEELKPRWNLIAGTSRRCMPPLLLTLGEIDLFIHDSLHSERNVRFEIDRAWQVLRPGGALVVDDVDTNWGFHSFVQAFRPAFALVCEAEPVRPDVRRFNNKGLFGIVLKSA